MRRYLVVGAERESDDSAPDRSDIQSTSIEFAGRLFQAATGMTADAATYIEFRDRLFKGPKRLFDYVDIDLEGDDLHTALRAGLQKGVEGSSKIILVGKRVAGKISRNEVPPERRVEIDDPRREKYDAEDGVLDILISVDPYLWEAVVNLALELMT